MKTILIILALTLNIASQTTTLRMLEIIDSDTFLFIDSSIVRLHGLKTPSLESDNVMIKEIAKK